MSTMCKVKNRGAGFVTYRIPEDGIRRSFAPGEVKQISYEELEKLTFQAGGLAILTKYLQIQDVEAVQQFNIPAEPEYFMSEQDIIQLMKNGSLDAFLDALDFAPVAVIDLIKKFSTELPLTDMAKRKALKEKTGFDVDSALRHIEEDKEDDGQNTILKTSSERRVKPETTNGNRRTSAPKYNIIKTAETTAE